jgi:hypothetical protein
MSIESTSEFTQALMARVARFEHLKMTLGRKPTDAEMGKMPTPGEVDIMLAELEISRRQEKAIKPPKPSKWTRPDHEVAEAAMIARSRCRAVNIKATTGGLIGVTQFANGNWQARFTPPKGYGCNAHTSTHATLEQAVEARNAYVSRYYGDTRPWLFAEILTKH